MSTINPEIIQRVKDASNIHDIIGYYILLRRAA
jgi:DNA primase